MSLSFYLVFKQPGSIILEETQAGYSPDITGPPPSGHPPSGRPHARQQQPGQDTGRDCGHLLPRIHQRRPDHRAVYQSPSTTEGKETLHHAMREKGLHQEDNDDGEEGHHENRHRYKEAVEKVMEYVTPFSIEIDAEGNVVSEAQQSAHPLRLQVFKRQLPPGAASTPSRCCACSSPSTPGRPSPSP